MSLKVGLLKEHNFGVFKGQKPFSLKTLLRVIKYNGVKLCGKNTNINWTEIRAMVLTIKLYFSEKRHEKYFFGIWYIITGKVRVSTD